MLCAIFAILFGFSLLPGRTPLCLRFAARISDGIMPEGAASYCRRLTWVWFWVLLACAGLGAGLAVTCGVRGVAVSSFISPVAVAATFLIEGQVRRRRFSVTFRTSGSTSKPKKIVKTFASLAKEVAFHRARLALDPGTVFLSTIEPDHMYGTLWRVMLPAAAGCQVDPEVILTPEALIEKMAGAKKVFFVTTPSFLKRFCAYADAYGVPQNCVEMTTSGALLDAETSAAAKRVFGVAPLEIFGSTETVFDPVKVRVSADGRLVVRSPFSFRRDFVMGDGVELAPDGRHFKLLGRRDRLAKIAEQRVSLPEMEEKMKRLADIDDVALIALDGAKGPYLGAVIVQSVRGGTKLPSGADILALRRRLIPLFPKGTAPKRFRFVADLPRNAQGKVLDSSLRELFAEDVV